METFSSFLYFSRICKQSETVASKCLILFLFLVIFVSDDFSALNTFNNILAMKK